LKINLAKSKLVPMGIVDNVDGLAGIVGCKVSPPCQEYGVHSQESVIFRR
jgi:hypothetical protein